MRDTFKYILILLFLCGCQTPMQQLRGLEAKHDWNEVEVDYEWTLYRVNPYCIDGRIVMNATALPDYKACETEVLFHERYHIAGLEHCKNKGCLMYYRLHRIHMINKTLCRECRGRL